MTAEQLPLSFSGPERRDHGLRLVGWPPTVAKNATW